MRIALLDPCRFQRAHHYDEDNIAAILADLTDGSRAIHNPVHVIPKGGGRWEIVAGHDRVEAAKRAGLDEVPHRDFGALLITGEQVYSHWRRDNVLRKQPDRIAAAEESLIDWKGEWADRRVAVACGVSPSTVATIRRKLEELGQLSKLDSRKGADDRERTYKPRQVRGSVPSGKTIPHPTEKVSTASPQGAGREAPERQPVASEPGKPSTESGTDAADADSRLPEVGAPTGAPLVSENPDTQKHDTAPAPAMPEADGDPQHAPESEEPGTPAVELTAGASISPAHTPSAFKVREAIRASVGLLPDPTDADAAVLTAADREWFQTVSRWAQRWALRCPQTSAAA